MRLNTTLTFLAALLLSFSAAAKEDIALNIIPYPNTVEVQKGLFKASGAIVNCDPSFDSRSQTAVHKFANQLSLVSGKVSSFATPAGVSTYAKTGEVKGFVFYKDSSLASGEYSLNVSSKSAIVAASDFYGVLYAIATIKQMLPKEIYGSKSATELVLKMPCAIIKDKPRFGYRGMHLDCSRHFFSVDEVKKYLDIMAIYKLNTLHWHLTDDQGWRVEIKAYPELTQIGAYRNGTMIGHERGSNDGIRYGGYYTQEQVKDVIAYADDLGITIIPEVDLPGHMVAALAAYPELGCNGGPYEVWTKWGISDQVLCIGKEETFTFLEGVLGELADLFPAEYFHIGGDECPKTEWEKCELCQARIKELGFKDDKNATAEQYLQSYVTARVQAFLATKGKKIIGWDEILEGDLAEGATVMSWRGTEGGIKAAARGFDVIMTPTTYVYFDYCQVADRKDNAKEPLNIGGNLPIEKVYSYEPFDGFDAESTKHILGVQANLWTEYLANDSELEYMLLPRMLALSEVQWCDPADKDFERFKTSLVNHEFGIFDYLGYNYSKVVVGIFGLEK